MSNDVNAKQINTDVIIPYRLPNITEVFSSIPTGINAITLHSNTFKYQNENQISILQPIIMPLIHDTTTMATSTTKFDDNITSDWKVKSSSHNKKENENEFNLTENKNGLKRSRDVEEAFEMRRLKSDNEKRICREREQVRRSIMKSKLDTLKELLYVDNDTKITHAKILDISIEEIKDMRNVIVKLQNENMELKDKLKLHEDIIKT